MPNFRPLYYQTFCVRTGYVKLEARTPRGSLLSHCSAFVHGGADHPLRLPASALGRVVHQGQQEKVVADKLDAIQGLVTLRPGEGDFPPARLVARAWRG